MRPWVMLSAGAGMEPFRRICAFEPGASGYLAEGALWWQALQHFPDLDAFRRELRRESSPYIAALVSGCTAPARPWTGCPAVRRHPSRPEAGPAFFREYGT
jgi:tagatose 1,6-diphosphate aldolase